MGLRHIFLIVMAVVFAAVVSCENSSYTNSYIASDTNIHYMGRVLHVAEDTVRFTYPGTSIVAAFEGERIHMNVKPRCGAFVVEVDDRPAHKITVGDEGRVLVADSLAWRTHHVRIMYVVEGYELLPEFYGLEVDGRLVNLPAEMVPQMSIEFIGNSITCGYGVESTNPEEHFSYATENHYKSYAAIAARRLGARHTAIARSGIGIYRNYAGPREGSEEPMPAVYRRTLFGDSRYEWNFATQAEPDIVCVNLGTNDTSTESYDVDLLRNAYANFVAELREIYPTAKIVMLTGSMLQGQALEDVKRALDEVVAATGDSRILRFDMEPQTGELGYGADYHPSEKQQEKMGEELTEFLVQNAEG